MANQKKYFLPFFNKDMLLDISANVMVFHLEK